MTSSGDKLRQISVVVNLSWPKKVWRALVEISFMMDKRTNNSRIINKGAEPQSGTTNCLKRQDCYRLF